MLLYPDIGYSKLWYQFTVVKQALEESAYQKKINYFDWQLFVSVILKAAAFLLVGQKFWDPVMGIFHYFLIL